ncbi:hypothetical protein [Pseudoalteromonas sp. S2755]|uniref:hypothetical protein n=1 Tax=Pseudoalteromonas sp. S2755 TaxID=2066523 RepID=UPI00110A618D|nr:hypothetical protein [Pseudoalteromonas sp. S2755]TMN38830.1 hypothetical protein CWC03_10810 [Pseudoalteromonas sp. S2755]
MDLFSVVVILMGLLTLLLSVNEFRLLVLQQKISSQQPDFTNVLNIEVYLATKSLGITTKLVQHSTLAQQAILLRHRDELIERRGS